MRGSLIDLRMADGSRHFGDLPESNDAKCPQWHSLRAHLAQLPGAVVTGFVTDEVTEAWLDFTFRGHEFSMNNQLGDWWFFVKDPTCPDAILVEVLEYCRRLLGSREP